jgi:hypothetical protein
MLSAHSRLHIVFEEAVALRLRYLYPTRDLEAIIRALLEDFPSFREIDFDGLRDDVRMLGTADFEDVVALLHRRVSALHGKAIWGDKSPAYCRHILPVAMMFPGARFIQIVRDPRAVANSFVRHKHGPGTYWHAAREWAYSVGLVTVDFQTLGPRRALTIRFEDLVGDPEATLRGVCRFLDLDWESSMLRADNRGNLDLGSKSMNRLHRKSSGDIDAQRAVSWSGTRRKPLQHIESTCLNLMRFYQYEPVFENPVSPSAWEELGYKVTNRFMRYWKWATARAAGFQPLRYRFR